MQGWIQDFHGEVVGHISDAGKNAEQTKSKMGLLGGGDPPVPLDLPQRWLINKFVI